MKTCSPKRHPHKTNPMNFPVNLADLNARPDTLDFRDKIFVPTLVEVPVRVPLETYQARYSGSHVPVLHQGTEGACTGFGLAAVANFLLCCRGFEPDPTPVSPRMFYEMARRYDEWTGENYSGSSARGAMKGWHKHGVCQWDLWPYNPNHPDSTLTNARAEDAAKRPLGAYFRVNHRDLVSMHSALAEVGILYATAKVHRGWGQVGADGLIPFTEEIVGGHAFAVVGYNDRGFWIQNSWGPAWGHDGFGLISYEDWLNNATDVWVARLGAPVQTATRNERITAAAWIPATSSYSFHTLRPHIISIGNNGTLRSTGTFGTSLQDLQTIFTQDIPRITQHWRHKRILLYAHGGLVSEDNALQRVEEYRKPLLEAEVYPLAFVWKTDFWTTLANILKDAIARRRPEGVLDNLKDFMLDRLDDSLEPLARPLGKALWDEMKQNALLATTAKDGGARLALPLLARLLDQGEGWEVHVAGHSAGSIFMAPLVQLFCSKGAIAAGPAKGLTGMNRSLESLTLWAPACTMRLFKDAYLAAVRNQSIRQFALFTLKDAAEQDDNCANVYHKSLLYLVSNALEDHAGLFFLEGEPLAGMEEFILRDPDFDTPRKLIAKADPPVVSLFGSSSACWIRSPNSLPEGLPEAAHARQHGAFDDDPATVKATLARILGNGPITGAFDFKTSAAKLRECRRNLQ